MTQTTLFDHLQKEETKQAIRYALKDYKAKDNNRLKASFLTFNDNNPHVFDAFCELTLKTIKKGFTHYGARDILHLLRWHTGITTECPLGLKVNNNHSPFYGRMFEAVFPEYRNFFRKRRSAAD